MNRVTAIFYLLAIWVFVTSATAQPLRLSDPAVLNTNAATDGENDDDEFAEVFTDGKGVWICAWRTRGTLGGTISGGGLNILFARSTDNGQTWSDPLPLNTNAATSSSGHRQPRLAADGNGNWIAVWISTDPLGGTLGDDEDVLFATSSDGGLSWSAPGLLNSNGAGDSGVDTDPEIATDGAGNWVVTWNSVDDLGGTVGIDSDIMVSRSVDNGASWSAAAAVNSYATFDLNNDTHAHISTNSNGTWVIVWDSNSATGGGNALGTNWDMAFARSIDNGATWGPAQVISPAQTDDTNDELFPYIENDGAGTWIVSWSTLKELGEEAVPDFDMLVSRSTDDGVNWSVAQPLNTDALSDSLNENEGELCTDGNGYWIGIWYSFSAVFPGGTSASFFHTWSADNGATWSAPERLIPGAATQAWHNMATDRKGSWVLVWHSSNNVNQTIGFDPDIFVATSNTFPRDASAFIAK
jgi:hypothetical protein